MPLPTPNVMILFTSFRCDARCIMCYTWVKQRWEAQLSLEQVERIVADPFLRRSVELINLTGGEPTLREDLVDIVSILVERCQRLRCIDIPTNGFQPSRVIDRIERILARLAVTDVELAVTVSVDGIGAVHEAVRGRAGVFPHIDRTIEELKELREIYPRFRVGLNTVISRVNATRECLEPMRAYARSHQMSLNFTPAAVSEVGVESVAQGDRFEITAEQKPELIGWFEQLRQERALETRYADFVLHWLRTGKRNLGCAFRAGKTFLVEPNGNLYLCGNYKEFRLGNLLEEPLSVVWPRQRRFTAAQWDRRCDTCASNCYLDNA